MSDSNLNVRPQREDSVQDDPPADCYKPPQLGSAKVINANHLSALRMDSDEDRRLWRRIDMRLIPLLTVMYLVAFIDKTNIGNAKIQGLTAQLMLTGNQFNIVLTLNFVANCAFALPANLLLKRLRPSAWLPGITIVWGIITTLQGLVKTYHQLLALRVCLGIAEAGLSPGILYYLTLWYPRYMLQYRIGLFWGGAAFAGAFSGLLAYGISFMSGLASLEGWSWIFIIEGILSVWVGVVAACLENPVFVDYPRTAKFLKPEERSYVAYRMALDTSSNMPEDPDFSLRYLVDALLDWQVWAGCLIELSIITPVYGISLFLPSIIDGFGFGPAVSQLLSIPPYVVATATVVLWATSSDRLRRRSPFVLLGLVFCLIGFALNVSNRTLGVKYFGTFLVVIGGYAGFPAIPSWLGNNLVGHCKRGTGMALQAISGQVGGIIASNIYRTQGAPLYTTGHAVEMGFVGMGIVLVPAVVLIYARINTKREKLSRRLLEERSEEEPSGNLGDKALCFRYTL